MLEISAAQKLDFKIAREGPQEAFTLRRFERTLQHVIRDSGYLDYLGLTDGTLTERLKKDARNVAAKRRRLMKKEGVRD